MLLFEAITLPPPWDLEEVSLLWVGLTWSHLKSRPRKKHFDLDMCWLQKHKSGRTSHTEVQGMVYLSSPPHSYAVFDSATAVSWRKLQRTTSPGTLNGRCTHSKAVGTSNHNIP